VIVKSEGKELPDETYEHAAALAAYYSSGRDNDKVEIDYLQKKNVKKPNNAVPGFVVYYTNYSMMATPGTAGLEQIN
jgi:predicted ribosome quality control (RQC) complex YloA/Tae2 family protein